MTITAENIFSQDFFIRAPPLGIEILFFPPQRNSFFCIQNPCFPSRKNISPTGEECQALELLVNRNRSLRISDSKLFDGQEQCSMTKSGEDRRRSPKGKDTFF